MAVPSVQTVQNLPLDDYPVKGGVLVEVAFGALLCPSNESMLVR
jgi:hypothetical protein